MSKENITIELFNFVIGKIDDISFFSVKNILFKRKNCIYLKSTDFEKDQLETDVENYGIT